MENLPQEILIKIFDDLKINDLLSLTLVCKDFNDIISNTKQLVEKLVLRFTAQAKNHKLEATRKYTKISMRYSYCQNLLQFLEKQGEYITNIRFMFIKMELWTLKAILNFCRNLKNLTFLNFQVDITSSGVCEPLPKLKLDYLCLNCDRRVLKLLMKSSVKSLMTYSVYSDELELKLLIQFLKNQKYLEKLEFSSFRQDTRLFESDKLNEVDFRLKEFNLQSFLSFPMANFEKFLKNHSESLERVLLKQFHLPSRSHAQLHYEISELFREMKNLKKLELRAFHISDIKTFHYVEELILEEYSNIDSKIHTKFPNLKTLRLFSPLSVHESFLDFSISSIEKLEINYAKNITWIFIILNIKDTNLKYLKIRDSVMCDDTRKAIENLCNNSKNIKLEIIQTEKSNDDEIDFKFQKENSSSESSNETEEDEGEEEIEDEEESDDDELTDGTEDDELEFIFNEDVSREIENLENFLKRRRME
ncbi:hypothetical protein PVAND_014488 [Polypedilum vanderplanki]|uniref:F-box domain-containing protein n=1 Tax=Polypedilum vanderplanki TaxID=319348 RepID=A0A9J6B9U5_POLVA|nr:hypothetical protein PVAND_014488 [Polypedilum vanderplanki]